MGPAVARREGEACGLVVVEEGIREGPRCVVRGGENEVSREGRERGGRKGGVGALQVSEIARVSPGLRSRRSEVRIFLGS